MKKVKKIFAIAAFMALLLTARCISVSANSSVDIDSIGTSLMTTLLERQFTSFMDGSVCDTSDIMTDSESNEFYNYFMEWESRSRAALGEPWAKYEYDLSLTESDGNTLKFTNLVNYWIEINGFKCRKSMEYEITIGKIGKDYYITSISTTDYNEFKNLIKFKAREQSGRKNSKTRTMSEYVDELVNDSRNSKAVFDSMANNKKDVAEEDVIEEDVAGEDVAGKEQLPQEPLNNSNAVIPLSTAYSCSSALDWFAGLGSVGTTVESVTGLWNLLNISNPAGPGAAKYNNNGICTNIAPSSINNWQILQANQVIKN